MNLSTDIDRAIDNFRGLYNVKPKYLILSRMGKNLLDLHFGGMVRNKISELVAYKGLQIIITKRRDIIFDLF